ncbi:MAG TPA: adenylate/guanylate cyclase domain-containing protein [Candidatus Dormibacteraeota bacterium]|nr:adenylate/guanylate cyclase domain-containing protein [Candidatus Dormibacteraeota bacterium]
MPLSDGAALPEGTATFLFTDIQGSTVLVQQLGIERWKEILDTHYRVLREQFDAFGGAEVNTEGDAFFIAFSQASQAVAACAAGQRALYAYDWPEDAVIRVRMGLHTGEAALIGNDYVGLEIHRAARIASSAHGGQVVLSDATRSLVEGALPDGVSLVDLGEHRLKDLSRPEHIWQLRIDGLPGEFPALKSLDKTPNNLPTQLTSFVGREHEVAEGLRLLDSSRLLTLTGPGGTGKTRLSMQIGAEASDNFKHGVFFIPLAPVSDPALVPSTVLQAMGIHEADRRPPQDQLIEHLKEREVLLILDNFEQLLPAAPYVGEVLKASPSSKAVATSRAALRVYGEQEYPIPPLPVPENAAEVPLEELAQYEGIKLFIERAVAMKPDFTLTKENAAAVAGIASLVDGLPLAIELAAARIKLLPPKAMLERLKDRLGDLGGGARDLPERQQTIRGAIAWSYDLMDEPTQRLFARFSVFVRGASLDQIEAVCGPSEEVSGDIIGGLETLVEHNLLRSAEDDEDARFFMLHVIREYALERLEAMPNAREIHARHATAFEELARLAAPQLTGADQKQWLDRLELENDNLRAAQSWLIGEKDEAGAAGLVASTWRFWQMRGHLFEGRQRAEETLSVVREPALRYTTLEAAGGIAYWQGEQATANDFYHEALDIARAGDDKRLLANALYNAAFPDIIIAESVERAEKELAESLELFGELGDDAGRAKVLWASADLHYMKVPREWQRAIDQLLEAKPIFEKEGDKFSLAWCLYTLGGCYMGIRQFDAAAEALNRSLEMFRDADDRSGIVLLFDQMALLAIAQGDMVGGARLDGAARALEQASGVGLIASRVTIEPELEEVAKHLSESQPEEWAAGQKMSVDEAIAYALDWKPAGARSAPS